MTAKITPGQDFSDNVVSAQRLNDLVDNASIYDIGPTCLATGIDLFRNSQPSGDHGRAFIDDNTGHILFHNGATFVDLASDIITITLRNADTVTLQPSWVVMANGGAPNTVRLVTSIIPEHRVTGVAMDFIAPGQDGPICVRGIVPVAVVSIASSPGAYLRGPTNTFPYAAIPFDDPTPGSGTFRAAFFAMTLEPLTGAQLSTVMAYVWR
jgi:hypothetical protein